MVELWMAGDVGSDMGYGLLGIGELVLWYEVFFCVEEGFRTYSLQTILRIIIVEDV